MRSIVVIIGYLSMWWFLYESGSLSTSAIGNNPGQIDNIIMTLAAISVFCVFYGLASIVESFQSPKILDFAKTSPGERMAFAPTPEESPEEETKESI